MKKKTIHNWLTPLIIVVSVPLLLVEALFDFIVKTIKISACCTCIIDVTISRLEIYLLAAEDRFIFTRLNKSFSKDLMDTIIQRYNSL